MPFGPGSKNPSTRRVKKTTLKAKWNKTSREISKPLLVLRMTSGGKVSVLLCIARLSLACSAALCCSASLGSLCSVLLL